MIFLLILGVFVVVCAAYQAYRVGFWLGTLDQEEYLRSRVAASEADRRLYDVTLDAFEAMVNHVDRRRNRY